MEHISRSRLEEILDDWDLDDQMNRTTGSYDYTQSTGYEPVTCSISDTINLGALGANVSLTSPFTYTGVAQNYSNSIYTIGPGNTSTTWTASPNANPWMTSTLGQVSAPKIKLDGEGADIEVNGWSLVDAVKRIEERLGLFQPNLKLEEEWEELKALGEQYRKLEQHIKDKQATWDRIKAMPAPDID